MRTAVEEVVVLRRQNEVLSERVAYLEGQLAVVSEECQPEWGLTKSEARLMGLLLRADGKIIAYQALISAMWGLDEPGNALGVILQFAHSLRKKVAPFGIRIQTVRGIGFRTERVLADEIAQNVS